MTFIVVGQILKNALRQSSSFSNRLRYDGIRNALPAAASQTRGMATWNVAVVGSGPSGFYTAKYLNSSKSLNGSDGGNDLSIDILERLPTAYGLVRSGVAPDHPEVKNVQNDFDSLMETNSNIQFFGNVNVGKDISLQELRRMYDVVVLAYGCEADQSLKIPGSDLRGILSAREFVAWYNGHVDFAWVGPIVQEALSKGGSGQQNIVVLGHGNVALDCARILAKSREELDPTDIATRALNVLSIPTRPPRKISVVGRRGHVQAAFTIKELRELTKLPNADFVVRGEELEMGKSNDASLQELNDSRPRKRMDALLTDAANVINVDATKDQVHLRFLVNPVRFESSRDDSTALGYVVCERTKLEGEAGRQRAVGTGEEEVLEAQLALVSIGYKGVAIDGTEPWFDESRGTMTNVNGLIDAPNDGLGGLYTSGWLKRGPSGIIGSNIADAKDTVASIVHDAVSLSPKSEERVRLLALLKERGVRVVDWNAYKRIDRKEQSEELKRHLQQPREKITTFEEQLAAASLGES